jgi:hypothetical protein
MLRFESSLLLLNIAAYKVRNDGRLDLTIHRSARLGEPRAYRLFGWKSWKADELMSLARLNGSGN